MVDDKEVKKADQAPNVEAPIDDELSDEDFERIAGGNAKAPSSDDCTFNCSTKDINCR